ncbi:hypothetical protein AgCh_030028 [Apium graveolens]
MNKFPVIPWSYLIGNYMCGSGFISNPAPTQQMESNAIIKGSKIGWKSNDLFEMQKTDSGFLKIRVREEFIFRLMEAAAKEDEKRKKMMLVEKNFIKNPSNNNWVKESDYKIDGDGDGDDDEVNSLF